MNVMQISIVIKGYELIILSDNLLLYVLGVLILFVIILLTIQSKRFRKFLLGILVTYLTLIAVYSIQHWDELVKDTTIREWEKGTAYLKLGDFKEAENVFQELIKDAGSDSLKAMANCGLSSAYCMHAQAFKKSGERDRADYYFTLALLTSDVALRIRSDIVDIRLSRCALLIEMERFPAARACCDSILRRDPKNDMARMLRDSARGREL